MKMIIKMGRQLTRAASSTVMRTALADGDITTGRPELNPHPSRIRHCCQAASKMAQGLIDMIHRRRLPIFDAISNATGTSIHQLRSFPHPMRQIISPQLQLGE